MRNDAILAAGLAALLLAAGGVALCRRIPWKEADSLGAAQGSASSVWQAPPGATAEQHLALQEHLHAGGPLPAGFALESEVARRFTGRVDPAGKRELSIEVKARTADLEEARVYVDGALQATATRAGGGIVDRPADGTSTAALTVWIAPAGRSFEVAVRWDTDPGGPTHESLFSVRVPWYREWLAKLFSG